MDINNELDTIKGQDSNSSSTSSTSRFDRPLNPPIPSQPPLPTGRPKTLPSGAGQGTSQAGKYGANKRGASPEWPLPLPNNSGKIATGEDSSKRDQALTIYESLGDKFNKDYETSVTKAYRGLLKGIRANQRLLVDGGLYTAKELDERVDELQSHLKAGGDEGKISMADMFNQWLNEPPKELAHDEV